MTDSILTVGDLRRQLAYCSDDIKLTFGGGLTFYRVKDYDGVVHIEFNEPQAYLDPKFRKRNPQIQVAFVNADAVEWDNEGLVGSIDVSIQ